MSSSYSPVIWPPTDGGAECIRAEGNGGVWGGDSWVIFRGARFETLIIYVTQSSRGEPGQAPSATPNQTVAMVTPGHVTQSNGCTKVDKWGFGLDDEQRACWLCVGSRLKWWHLFSPRSTLRPRQPVAASVPFEALWEVLSLFLSPI